MGNVKIIGASAGSGKTYRLAYEYVKAAVSNPAVYRHILAVTFTNKATEEMKSRILARIHELASGAKSEYLDRLRAELGFDEKTVRARALEARTLILHDYSRFAVLTIDRFFQRLIRSFIRELGVDIDFNLQLETDSLLAVAADTLIEDISTDEGLRRQLFSIARDRIENNRRWDVREPLLGIGKELFNENYRRAHDRRPADADAGSLIEAVVAEGEAAASQIAAAAIEALRIIRGNGLTPDDFKGKSRGLVPWLVKVADGALEPPSKPAAEALESDANWAHRDSANRGLVESLVPRLRPLLQRIGDLYENDSRLIRSAALLRENYRNFLLLGDLQRRVERICAEENIMPISETNRMIAQLVSDNDAPFIFEKAGNYYSLFMIDEFQDTSSSQWESFVPLLKNAMAGEEGDPVMLIGDVKQAIYRWRGGDWRILSRRVREEMGRDRVGEETLDTNYRSLSRVVEFNNALIGLAVEAGNADLDKTVAEARAKGAIGDAEAASLTGLLAEAYSGHAQKPKGGADGGYVTITLYGPDGEGDYVPPVIEKIEELQSRDYAPGDIAILVRSNTQAARIARMLLERKHDNPDSPYCYDVITQEALTVGSSRAARFIIACLSLAADPGDSIQRAVYNRWTGRDFGAEPDAGDLEFFARTASLPPEEAFEEIVMRYGLQSRREDIAYIQAVHEQINTFSSRSVADIPLFLKWWNGEGEKASITMQGTGSAITVSTIHKSKGLQYRAVIIPYLSWRLAPESGIVWAEAAGHGIEAAGSLPVRYKEEMAGSFFAPDYYRETVMSYIDAVNMFYVAVTRAEEELHLMIPDNPRSTGRIGNLVRRVLHEDGAAVEAGGVKGAIERGDETTVIRFGSPAAKRPGEPAADKSLHTYPTARPGAKVRLRLPSSRYFEQGDVELSPRDFGILMHQAFENSDGYDDVRRALGRMLACSKISEAEHGQLAALIEKAFANPLVGEWFGDGWDAVRRENDIMVPGGTGTKRPDRVMTGGGHAVVVDYKFGRRKQESYGIQLRGYMELLRGMGYADVSGYIWYVSLDEIEKVD